METFRGKNNALEGLRSRECTLKNKDPTSTT